MIRTLFLLAATTLMSVGVSVRADDAKKPVGDKKSGDNSFTDAAFVAKAASGGMLEVELGKMAASQAKTDEVKKLGQKLADDHGKANDALKAAAKNGGLTVPEKMIAEHQKVVDKFKAMKGDEFDKEYVQHMVKSHEAGAKAYMQASQEAKDAGVKDFAAKTLPVIEEHLAMAKKMQK